jgi:hypothetical protein
MCFSELAKAGALHFWRQNSFKGDLTDVRLTSRLLSQATPKSKPAPRNDPTARKKPVKPNRHTKSEISKGGRAVDCATTLIVFSTRPTHAHSTAKMHPSRAPPIPTPSIPSARKAKTARAPRRNATSLHRLSRAVIRAAPNPTTPRRTSQRHTARTPLSPVSSPHLSPVALRRRSAVPSQTPPRSARTPRRTPPRAPRAGEARACRGPWRAQRAARARQAVTRRPLGGHQTRISEKHPNSHQIDGRQYRLPDRASDALHRILQRRDVLLHGARH